MAGGRLGVIAATVAIALGAAGCGAGAKSADGVSSFGHMAGYVWSGHVRAVAGSWWVPRMSGAGDAHASTWIGAQAPGVPRRSPFIQVGQSRTAAYPAPRRTPRSGPTPRAGFTPKSSSASTRAMPCRRR